MIVNPMSVTTADYLSRCVDYFRKMHVRHMVVLSPIDGKLEGIITRKDLFKYMDL